MLAFGCPLHALKTAQEHPGSIDLLLSDIRLPEMHGDDLAERLRTVRPKMGVVFMSGLSTPPVGEAAFVQKPIDLDALIATLEQTLAASQSDHL